MHLGGMQGASSSIRNMVREVPTSGGGEAELDGMRGGGSGGLWG